MSFLDGLIAAPALKTATGQLDITTNDPSPGDVLTAVDSETAEWAPGSSAIVTRYNEGDGLRIEKFAAGGVLTRANFDAAMRAAQASCYSSYDGAGWAGKSLLIPAGNWDLDTASGPIVFPGTFGSYGYVAQGKTPGIRGIGGSAACVMWVQGAGLAAGRGMIEIGVVGGDTANDVKIEGISIASISALTLGSGIRFRRQTLLTSLRDVSVFGFGGAQGPDDGYGIAFDWVDPPGWHQHVHMSNVRVQGCQVGAKLTGLGQFTFDQLHLNQNLWMSAVMSFAAGTWHGGTMQEGEDVTDATKRGNYWYGGALHPCLATGFDVVLRSGTGAQLATATYATDPDCNIANAGRCIVTGLVGAALTIGDVGRWLYLSNSEAYGYGNIVRGMYQISRVLGPESCEILKGTSHALTTGLDYEIRSHRGCNVDISGYLYHEGDKRCMFFIGPNDGANTEQWVIRDQQPQNTTGIIAESGQSTLIDIQNMLASGTPIGRITNTLALRTNEVTSQWGTNTLRVDDFTRRGMESRGQTRRARRLTAYVKEVGGFSWLAKHTSTIDFPTATEVGEWRSAQDPTVKFDVMHAGEYCTYDAADAGFGGPAITIVGGTAGATYKGLRCTIPSAKLPSGPCFLTLIAIGRLSSTVVDPGGVRRIHAATSDGVLAHAIGVHDGAFFAGGAYSVPYSSTFGGNAPSQPAELATVNTDPWLIISGGDYASGYGFDGRMTSWGPISSAFYAPAAASKFYRAAGTDVTIELPLEYAAGSTPFVVAGFALLPLMCSPSAVDTIRELIATEWPDKFEI